MRMALVTDKADQVTDKADLVMDLVTDKADLVMDKAIAALWAAVAWLNLDFLETSILTRAHMHKVG